MDRDQDDPATPRPPPPSDRVMNVNPLVALIRSQPGMAERLLADHTDDGTGRCRCCSSGGQTGRYQWPCAIHRSATQAHPATPTDPPAATDGSATPSQSHGRASR